MRDLSRSVDGPCGRVSTFVLAGLAAVMLALPAALWLARPDANLSATDRLASEIGCQCGTCPNRPIATCGCGFADSMLTELQTKVEAGMSDKAIMASFIAKYGPTARIKPEGSGLDFAAWLAPMLLLLVGGVAVAAFISHWHERADDLPAASGVPAPTADPSTGVTPVEAVADEKTAEERHYRQIVERELDELGD
ncbi:MAG: cytochrome c-type biogenesis protein CcmH [Acidobacteriota bacterium]